MENKKIRNPFPAIGKVIKYEFKHSARKLLPLYGVLLVLGLICGVTSNPLTIQNNSEIRSRGVSFDVSIDNTNLANTISAIGVFVLIITSIIVTVVVLENRYKKSMLGEEAYLNLSLPVTIGEHLWGRIIASVLWDLVCIFVIILSSYFCFMTIIHQNGGLAFYIHNLLMEVKEHYNYDNNFTWEIFSIILKGILLFCSLSLLVVSFIFLVDTTAQLFKKNKGVLEFVFSILLIVVTVNVLRIFPRTESISAAIIRMVSVSVIYFAGIYTIFRTSLNLE